VRQRDVGGETGRVGVEVSARNQLRGAVTGSVVQAGSPVLGLVSVAAYARVPRSAETCAPHVARRNGSSASADYTRQAATSIAGGHRWRNLASLWLI
jgi:hypothetical protein